MGAPYLHLLSYGEKHLLKGGNLGVPQKIMLIYRIFVYRAAI